MNHFTFGCEGFQTHRHHYPCLSPYLIPRSQQLAHPAHKNQIEVGGSACRLWMEGLPPTQPPFLNPLAFRRGSLGRRGGGGTQMGPCAGLPKALPWRSISFSQDGPRFWNWRFLARSRVKPKPVSPSCPTPPAKPWGGGLRKWWGIRAATIRPAHRSLYKWHEQCDLTAHN